MNSRLSLSAILFPLLVGCTTGVNPALQADVAQRDQSLIQYVPSILERCPDAAFVAKFSRMLNSTRPLSEPEIKELMRVRNLIRDYPGKEKCLERQAAFQRDLDLRKYEDLARSNHAKEAETAGDSAAAAGENEKAVAAFSVALRSSEGDFQQSESLRTKLLKLVASMPSPPALNEEARRHAVRGDAFRDAAQNPGGYSSAIAEYEQALLIAPWWADYYLNLALLKEQAKDYEGAIQALKLYRLATPKSPDAQAINDKIYQLEIAKEVANPSK